MMDFEEIKRRLKNGATVQILADLNGVPYKTMYNRIVYHERKDGCNYMPASSMRQAKKKRAEATEEIKEASPAPRHCLDCISCDAATSYCEEFCSVLTEDIAETCQCFYKKAEAYKEREKKEAAEIYTADLRDSLPADVYTMSHDIPEEITKEIHRKMVEAEMLAAKYRKLADGWRRALEALTSPEAVKV